MGSISLQIRPGDCDSFGHVNNAAYVALVEYALAQELIRVSRGSDRQPGADVTWELDSMAIEYRLAASMRDSLEAWIWVVEPDRGRPVFGFEVRRQSGEEDKADSLVRALASWRVLDKETGEETMLEDGALRALSNSNGTLPRPFKLPADSPDYRRYHWDHKVMRTEVDPQRLAHPQMIYGWIEEAIFEATAEAGWPMKRWLEIGLIVFQMRHDTTFQARPAAGERIRIVSRLVEARRRRGTWINEIFRLNDGALLVRNYSTGVFLDLEGRSAVPPEGMMAEIQYGA